LDHAGTTVYAKSLVHTFARDLVSNLYGNPQSTCTPANLSRQIVDNTRERTLRFFGADPEYFDLVFVANATAAIKLVTECFKDLGNTDPDSDAEGFWYGYHVDSHNSIVGVRECTEGEYHVFRSDAEVDEWLTGPSSLNPTGKLGLFAYPGQSNMTGRRLPLRWSGLLRGSTRACQRDTYSLFDAAALATTYPLYDVFQDPDAAPDFTALSMYKIFGFPDLGALIVRKDSGNILQYRKYFGGGTVSFVTVLDTKPWHEFKEVLHESLEDGTLPFHSIVALDAAISTHERLYGSSPMMTISRHTNFLIKYLYDSMSSLRHANGLPVCKIYKSNDSTYGDSSKQGPIISFNIICADGTFVPYNSAVERLADENNIFVRSGQLCNPGGIATHLGYEKWHIQRLWSHGRRRRENDVARAEVYHGRPTGVVRVSLGAMTTMTNIETLLTFLREQFMPPMVRERNPQRQTQLHSVMVMGDLDALPNQAENSSPEREENLRDPSPADLIERRTYDFAARPYNLGAPKKHVEFSFLGSTEDTIPMVHTHMIPSRPIVHRIASPLQEREGKQRLKRFFTLKEPLLPKSVPAQRSANGSAFVLM
jgi:molybdenum cofactor sulfurtransferase